MDFEVHEMQPRGPRAAKICSLVAGKYDFSPLVTLNFKLFSQEDASQFIFKIKRFVFAPEISFLTSRAKRSCFVWKGRRSTELPETALLERFFIVIYSFCPNFVFWSVFNCYNQSVKYIRVFYFYQQCRFGFFTAAGRQ